MTTEVALEKPSGVSWSEFTLMNAENEEEQELVDEFCDIGTRVTEHILKFLGGEKADRRVAAACRFFDERDITPSDRQAWLDADHDRRIFLCEERIEVMNLIEILFNQCLRDFWKHKDWTHHLENTFPKWSTSAIVVRFDLDNKKFIREYQNLINQLRCLYGNMLHEMGDDGWLWQ